MRGFGGLFLRVPRLGSLAMTRRIVFLVLGFGIAMNIDEGREWLHRPSTYSLCSHIGLRTSTVIMVGRKSGMPPTCQPFANVPTRGAVTHRTPKIRDLDPKIMFQTATNHFIVCFCTYTRNIFELTLPSHPRGRYIQNKKAAKMSRKAVPNDPQHHVQPNYVNRKSFMTGELENSGLRSIQLQKMKSACVSWWLVDSRAYFKKYCSPILR